MIAKILSLRFFLRLTVVSLLLLMVLVFWGTLYQADHGLYAAQERFFTSWYFLIAGWIPFPGGNLVMALLFVSLLVSMMSHFQFGWRRSGLILVHFGLLLLLAGGFVTGLTGQESFLTLREGEGANVSSSYYEWELSAWRAEELTSRDVVAFDEKYLKPGAELTLPALNLSLRVQTYHRHCRAFRAVDPSVEGPRNRIGIWRIEEEPRNNDPEEDQPGLLVQVRPDGGAPQSMLFYAGDGGPTFLETDDGVVALQLRRKQFPLPVVVQLQEFEKAFHPNSEIPEFFSSGVNVYVGDVVRDVTVSMNQPFRYGPYTFYQHAYASPEEGPEVSTFAVARNVGRRVPYVATGVTVLGLVGHFMVQLIPPRSRRKSR